MISNSAELHPQSHSSSYHMLRSIGLVADDESKGNNSSSNRVDSIDLQSDADEGEDGYQQGTVESQAKRMKKLTKRISQIIQAADVNNDGVVSYTEFLFAMAEGTGLTDSSSLQALTTAPAVIEQSSTKRGTFHKMLPSFNRKLLENNSGRRQTDGYVFLRGRSFKKRERSVFTASVRTTSQNTIYESKGQEWMHYFASWLPNFMQQRIAPSRLLSDSVDRVEHRGKGLHIVAHVDDSPLEDEEDEVDLEAGRPKKKARQPSFFNTPMLGRTNKARSSPILVTTSSKLNTPTSQRSAADGSSTVQPYSPESSKLQFQFKTRSPSFHSIRSSKVSPMPRCECHFNRMSCIVPYIFIFIIQITRADCKFKMDTLN